MRTFAYWATLGLIVPGTAFAQEDNGLGIRAGGFILAPSISVTEEFDSNVFLSETNEESTFRTIVAPRLEIRSDWNRHAVRLEAGAEYGFFTHDSDDQYLDYDVTLFGEVDITRAARINTSLGYSRLHDARGSIDAPGNIAEPIGYDALRFDIQGDVAFNVLQISPFLAVQMLDFDDAPLIGGGTNNQDDRDRVDLTAGVEVSYVVRRGYEAFVRGSYLSADYDAAQDDTGVNRDSDGWRVLGGMKLNLTRLLEGSVGVGYTQRNYDSAALSDISGLSAEAQLVWTPNRRLELTFTANRDIDESTLAGSSGRTTTGALFATSYELLRNLSINSELSFAQLDFEGISRVDNIFGAGLGLNWSVNRNFSIQPRYEFGLRDSNAAGRDYDVHRLSITGAYNF